MRRQVDKVEGVAWLLLKPVMGAKKGDKTRKKKSGEEEEEREREMGEGGGKGGG
jgi:hypothetical protein